MILHLREYNRVLSATEIKQLYHLGAAKIGHSNITISNGLVGYWTFDGPSIDWHTNTIHDMGGQGNTGSLHLDVNHLVPHPRQNRSGTQFQWQQLPDH